MNIVTVACPTCLRAFRTTDWIAQTNPPICPKCKTYMSVSDPEPISSLSHPSNFPGTA